MVRFGTARAISPPVHEGIKKGSAHENRKYRTLAEGIGVSLCLWVY
jgi:hypothetical protein